LNSPFSHGKGCPISRSFFARCGIPQTCTVRSRITNRILRIGSENKGKDSWYPTSREKRARCGPPLPRARQNFGTTFSSVSLQPLRAESQLRPPTG
jgi:hypothetical protein